MSYHYVMRALPFKLHRERVQHDLIACGVTTYGLMKSESRYLPRVINETEQIAAVIYGQRRSSSVMIIATDQRIIYLDKKPTTVHVDEISYGVVSGIKFDVHIFFATVILHTAVDNYEVRFVNLKCADKFAQYIEERIKETKGERTQENQFLTEGELQKPAGPGMLKKFERDFLYWMNQPDDDDS